ncbi:hypothetical protein D9615_000799 [Tricholomella constricta]|uniref:Uncharacterized protein n=1 Tax=Tricholomella constricta TaxID=117010 RepID=A0A8H5HSE0_9AGAR|nr:hypothetical protein D9615_000799 [Tricholomella constricta]
MPFTKLISSKRLCRYVCRHMARKATPLREKRKAFETSPLMIGVFRKGMPHFYQRLKHLYISSHIHTVMLFTWTDYKTIFLPITSFASATAPVHSLSNLMQGCIWIWFHLILCNVSNQARAKEEDAVNRPWRPIPSGRITVRQAVVLRWFLVIFCATWSATYGAGTVMATLGLVTVTVLYDEAGFSNGPFTKNLCNVGGYTAFEVGATRIMGTAATSLPSAAT